MNQKFARASLWLAGLASYAALAASPQIKNFSLIDTQTQKAVSGFDPIPDNAVIDLSKLASKKLNIRINTSGTVGSVKLEWNGKTSYENSAPFAAFGDDDGKFKDWSAATGSYTLKATLYSKEKGKGDKGDSDTLKFKIVANPVATPTTPQPDPEPTTPPQTPAEEPTTSDAPSDAQYVSPSESLQAAIDDLKSGETLVLHDGTFAGKVTVSKDNVTLRAEHYGKAIVKVASGLNLKVTASKVHLEGLVLDGGSESGKNAAANDYASNIIDRNSDGVVLESVEIRNSKGVGLSLDGKNIVASHLLAHDNGAAGIGGTHSENLLLRDSKIYHNNHTEQKSDGGGGKFTRTDGAVVDNVESYDNVGPGIWFDVWNTNVTVKNSYMHNNKGTSKIHGKGIMYELAGGDKTGKTWGMSYITNNRVENNDEVSGRAKDEQRGILISSTANVLIQNNTLVNDTICLKDGAREIKTDNIKVEDNKLINTPIIFSGASKSCCTLVNNGENAPGALAE